MYDIVAPFRGIFHWIREYFLFPWFWPSVWLTRMLERCYRQALQVCPLWKVSPPSSVTMSGAMWAAIHFCLPLPAVHLLFLSVGRLLPPIHLREAAARPRPLSWTDGKQSELKLRSGRQFSLLTSARLLATSLFNWPWGSGKWNGWGYQLNRPWLVIDCSAKPEPAGQSTSQKHEAPMG